MLTFESSKDYGSIVFSSPDLEAGASYDFSFGGTAIGDDVRGKYDAATYTDGDLAGTLAAG